MGVRFLLWLGAGALCAGVTVGMLAGAGTAFAQTGSDGDDGAKTSQSAKPAESQQDSSKDKKPAAAGARPGFGRNAANAINAVKQAVDDAVTKVVKTAGANDHTTATETTIAKSTRPQPGQRAAKVVNAVVNNTVAAVTHAPDRKVVIEKTREADPVERSVPVEKSPELRLVRNVRETLLTPTRSNRTLQTPALARPLVAAAPQPQIDVPPAISAIGTAVFGLISFAESVFEGPPKALPGSGVTVKRSTLDLADGHVVPADWYFPEGSSEDPPERIIYLQHGFLARGVFYDYTASYLAKETDSIVVAPTLTSNMFATDGMWLGGEPMHQAVADLFLDSNPALLESAQAAGYGQNQLPQQVVLIGHSLGGGLVIDTARYMKVNGTSDKLAGVVMLDGVSFTDPVPILKDLDGIPVYNLSATPYPWNLFGTMDAALAQVRPTDFTGAQMLFGFHSDAMVGGNPLIQFGAYLLTGYGGPANVAGSQVLAAGWINDLFNHDDESGFYGDPGSAIKIPTPVGPAVGLVQPEQGVLTSLAQGVTGVFFGLLAHINFATDVDPQVSQLAATVPSAAAPTGPTLINVIGTAAWNMFDAVSKLIDPAPSVPADSSVTVQRSTLDIDGRTVDADWYYPKSGTPDKFIYFQHGFPARAGFYNLTAAELAERNNAIVVAPTITGNLFAADGYSLGADPMHAAVARLFEGDREALTASAAAAGYQGELPEKFVIAGHSGGGQLAAGAAGYYYENAQPAERDNLVGVLLFDTSATGGALERALDKLPPTVPVLHIAAEPSAWDTYGNASDVLVAKRPTEFNGVQLIGGSHSDAFRSSSLGGLTQLIVGIGTGFSTPENVEAVQVLAQGYITDMYDPNAHAGVYGAPGSVITIPTDTGTDAHAYVLPGPTPTLSPIDRVILALLSSINTNDFVTCPAASGGSPSCSPAVAA
jgi:hypothetical protein